jgi:hypothetical protein
MRSSWQTETGRLVCSWSAVGQRVHYNPQWMQDTSNIQRSYLPPVPNFASHSPFGGASWFQRYTLERESE